MTKVVNSLSQFLDEELPTIESLDDFLNNLEDQVLGYSNREFYIRFKGDIKELLEQNEKLANYLSFEEELLNALLIYAGQRKI